PCQKPDREGGQLPKPRIVVRKKALPDGRASILLPLLEKSAQRPVLAIIDIVYPPAGRSLTQQEDKRFFLAYVFERYGHAGFGAFVFRFTNRKVLNIKILRVVQRITIKRADFAFRSYPVLPNHVGETLLEIFIK